MTGLPGLIGGAALRSAACALGVLLLLHRPDAVLWWLTGCWLLYQAGQGLYTSALAPAALSRDEAARTRLLRIVQSLATARTPPRVPLRDHLYAAAGVAIRWEPKPGAAFAARAHIGGSLLTVAALCGVLAAVAPALAAGSGACAVLAVGLVLRPRGLRARGTGRAGWAIRRREARTVTVLAGLLAVGAALVPVAGAVHRPDAVTGLMATAVLLARLVYGMTAADVGAVRHWQATRCHLREAERATPPGPVRGEDAPAGGRLVVVAALPSRLGFADLAENVHLGALSPGDSVPARLPRTVRLCGLEELAGSLPHGWRTVLSAEFSGGVDLDEDTWERIAAARISALLELGAAQVRLTGEPGPILTEVLADWSSRVGTRVPTLTVSRGDAF
ncbi:hypothetical protein AGRA3207_007228 [Actinomadura graeca]|uniref:Integral membrane protein n=1 Tax=Actinomadura graeca TaxID=2750812 RepID=A0ABX8R3U4_9ACTN|nr:hypothetical protein [Actinomadura graeca]QXJ25700.1 hypothetical protein AGRA3207_007228 [Actinomadura graeca]